MIEYLFGALALVTVGAYTCRVDELNWWHTPWLMLLHAAGGGAALWVLYTAAVAAVGVVQVLALACSVLLLLGTWSWLPANRHLRQSDPYGSDLMVSAPIISRRDDSRFD